MKIVNANAQSKESHLDVEELIALLEKSSPLNSGESVEERTKILNDVNFFAALMNGIAFEAMSSKIKSSGSLM